MLRKYWALHCDVKGCQFVTIPVRTKVLAMQLGKTGHWRLYTDTRKKQRALCPTHSRGMKPE